MKVLLLSVFISLNALASSWIDPNGTEWRMMEIRMNHHSALRECSKTGFHLPWAESFWQAIDLGLLDPAINTAFGDTAKKMDWVWTREDAGTPSFAMIASRWEDLVGEIKTQRHWVLCSK